MKNEESDYENYLQKSTTTMKIEENNNETTDALIGLRDNKFKHQAGLFKAT